MTTPLGADAERKSVKVGSGLFFFGGLSPPSALPRRRTASHEQLLDADGEHIARSETLRHIGYLIRRLTKTLASHVQFRNIVHVTETN